MTDRSAEHAALVVERTYKTTPARVFAAWADAGAKAHWFASPNSDYKLDFQVGGREVHRYAPEEGPVLTFDARYQEIVPDERIIYVYDLYIGERRASVSVATVEFTPVSDGTRLIFTEQGVFLDGLDTPAAREQGTRGWLNALGADLQRTPSQGGPGGTGRLTRVPTHRAIA